MIRAVIFDCTGVLVLANGVVNKPLLAYIRNYLKPKYKIGLLSNLSARSIEQAFTPGERMLFDAITLASETGVAKPDPRAYQLAADRLGVKPEQSLFVDDFERRCEAAREQGMQAVLYDSYPQVVQELESILHAQ